jgi:hypothetical protein
MDEENKKCAQKFGRNASLIGTMWKTGRRRYDGIKTAIKI